MTVPDELDVARNPNAELSQGLREIADWLDEHPVTPQMFARVRAFVYDDARRKLSEFAALLGDRATEEDEHGKVDIIGRFGGGAQLILSSSVRHLDGQRIERVEYEPIISGTSRSSR